MPTETKNDERHLCIGCRSSDNHPKVHILYGLNVNTGLPDFAHMHHDCTDGTPWHEQLMEDETFVSIREKALSGVRGDALRAHIEENVNVSKTAKRKAAK